MAASRRILLPIIITITAATAASGLKVIGAGLGRTGTDSLRLALNELGFGPTYHMIEVLGIPGRTTGDAYARNHVDKWPIFGNNDGETEDNTWDDLFEGYESAVDQPSQVFAVMLAKKYPDAKVILTVRSSAEKWHDSITGAWCRTSDGGATDWLDKFFYAFRGTSYFSIFSTFGQRFRRQNAALDGVFARTLGGDFADTYSTGRICLDRDYAVKFYQEWNQYVKKNIPRKRLLVMETGSPDMAEQVGKFLGVDKAVMANFTYPYVNSRKSFSGFGGPIFFSRLEAIMSIIGPVLVLALLRSIRRRFFGGRKKKRKAKSV